MITQINLEEICGHMVPDAVAQHPAMTTPRERALLFGLAKSHFRGQGTIIDAGIFLGGSTVAFAEGLLQNASLDPVRKAHVKSYDLARWVASMDRYLQDTAIGDLFETGSINEGDSFEGPLRKVLSKYDGMIDLQIGDMVALVPNHRGPIEIAFYDCLKDYTRDKAAFYAFTPYFMPGHTVILQQDYFYESAAFNKIRQEFYMDHFEFLGQVDTTAILRYVKPIQDLTDGRDPVLDLSIEQQVALIERAAERAVTEKSRLLTHLAALEHMIDQKRFDLAEQKAADLDAQIGRASLDDITRRPGQVLQGLTRRFAAYAG